MRLKRCIFAGIACISVLSLSGCRIQMTAEERVNGVNGAASQKTADGVDEAQEITMEELDELEASVVTVSCRPYDMKQLASIFVGMSAEEVDAKKESDELMYLATDDEIAYYTRVSAAGISIYDGAEYAQVLVQNDANSYYQVVHNLNEGEWTTDVNAVLAQNFEYASGQEEVQETAGELTSALNELGIEVAYWDCYIMDAQALRDSGANAPGYERDEYGAALSDTNQDWTDEDVAWYFTFRPVFDGMSVEDVNGESLLEIYYSPVTKSVLAAYLRPATFETTVSQEEKTKIISADEALVLAKSIMKESGLGGEITDVRLSYVQKLFSINYEAHTIQLAPAWKISYCTEVDGQSVTDCILLNASNGIQYTNETSLF